MCSIKCNGLESIQHIDMDGWDDCARGTKRESLRKLRFYWIINAFGYHDMKMWKRNEKEKLVTSYKHRKFRLCIFQSSTALDVEQLPTFPIFPTFFMFVLNITTFFLSHCLSPAHENFFNVSVSCIKSTESNVSVIFCRELF